MKYSKNTNPPSHLFFLLLFTTSDREKNIEKKYYCECRCSKKGKNSGFWDYFTATSTES